MKQIKEYQNVTTIEVEEINQYIGKTIQIHGSIYKIRKMKGFSFVLLRTKRTVVQCTAKEDFSLPLPESCVILTASVVSEPRSKCGFELRIQNLSVLSQPSEPSPIVINQKTVDTSIEHLLDFRPITLRNEKERAVFKLQEGICQAVREFLCSEHFTEIHSPKLVQAGAEGGANLFCLDYFGQKAFLAQSPQFYKQMMVGVFERVFEIAPVFRAEKHDTSRHLNEYTSIDLEMGYLHSFEDIMVLELSMLKHMMSFLSHHYHQEIQLLQITLPEIEAIPALHFRDAKEKISEAYHRPVKDWEDFEPEEEKLLSELIFKETRSEFVFVTHYPSSKRPFYTMNSPENSAETESFDLIFRGLEVTTGGQRIHNYKEQAAKMKERGMDLALFESYLMMHKCGMPPHGGLGLGLERLTAQLLGFENVRYATLFPRDVHRLIP